MSSFPFCAKSGKYFATGSFSRTFPCSTSCMTAVVVAITLVSDAISKIVSTVIGSRLVPARGYRMPCVDHLAVVANQQHRTRDVSLGNRLIDDRIDSAEVLSHRDFAVEVFASPCARTA